MKSMDYSVPISTVDICIFTVIDYKLKVLIHKRTKAPFKGSSSLVGGYVFMDIDDDLDETARRVLFTKTGVKGPYLEQVETIGNKARDPRGWAVTTLYFSLVDSLKLEVKEGEWLSLDEISELAFDHKKLLKLAIKRLQSKSRYTALPLSLLPETFTLSKAQEIFELILNHKLEKKSFRKRLIDSDCVRETSEKVASGKRKAVIYKLNCLYDFEFPRSLKFNQMDF